MFDKFLKRVEPKDGAAVAIPVGTLQPNILSASTTPSHSTHDLSGSRMPRKRSKSRSSTTERTLKLNAEQKCDIAQREIEELREEIERLEEESEKVLDHFKVGVIRDSFIVQNMQFTFSRLKVPNLWGHSSVT